ncbi:MAG: hypothetical protein JXD22_15665 [Sedimentisphaerales bacterium]|nr:hypothetical protein [Sedimentisphaerales bacterium]
MISKNIVIAFLIFSAVLLGCVLLLQNTIGNQAYAGNSIRAGRYAAATAQVDEDKDLLWLINTDSRLLSVFDINNNGVIIELDSIDLALIFESMIEEEIPVIQQPILPTSPTLPAQSQQPRPKTKPKVQPKPKLNPSPPQPPQTPSTPGPTAPSPRPVQ